jgi:uncharacterized membrane protein
VNRSDYRGARSAAIGARLIHLALMVFPIVFLVSALASDFVFWGTCTQFWARASEWLLAIGVFSGALAVDLGLIEFTTISRVHSRVAGRVYSLGSAAAILISLWSLLYRIENDLGAAVIPFGIILSAVVVVLFLFLATGWLGGKFVFRRHICIIDRKNESP